MPAWTSGELDTIGTAEELKLASVRRDGTLRRPVTMWVVRDGDDLYIRSVNGRGSSWFRGAQTTPPGAHHRRRRREGLKPDRDRRRRRRDRRRLPREVRPPLPDHRALDRRSRRARRNAQARAPLGT
jgi:hypothetical protein